MRCRKKKSGKRVLAPVVFFLLVILAGPLAFAASSDGFVKGAARPDGTYVTQYHRVQQGFPDFNRLNSQEPDRNPYSGPTDYQKAGY